MGTTFTMGWGTFLVSGCMKALLYPEIQYIWDGELMTLGGLSWLGQLAIVP